MPTEGFFEYYEVKWGVTFCHGALICQNLAVLLFDGQPLCFDCTDLLLERIEAIGNNPELRNRLPDLWDIALP